jgi:hypothetical protein
MKQRENESKSQGFWVRGSGLVHIPDGRAHEIPKVIEEFHKREAQRDQLLYSRRTW